MQEEGWGDLHFDNEQSALIRLLLLVDPVQNHAQEGKGTSAFLTMNHQSAVFRLQLSLDPV